jgi:hypothetical protein
MVGIYPDIPGPRMALDRDGTQLFANNVQQLSSIIRGMNSEDSSGSYGLAFGNTVVFVWMFPELRDLQGYYVTASPGAEGGGAFGTFQWSANSTNGIDGTWTNIVAGNPATANIIDPVHQRQNIQAASITGIKAIRLTWSKGLSQSSGGCLVHLYGKPSTGQNPNRLEFWHPTLDQSLNVTPAFFDWGDRPRNTVAVKQVRVKNLSPTLTANTIVIGTEAITDTSPTFVGQHQVSWDAVNYSSTLNLSTLASGVISSPIYVQQSLLSSAVLSLWTQRLYANVGSWS